MLLTQMSEIVMCWIFWHLSLNQVTNVMSGGGSSKPSDPRKSCHVTSAVPGWKAQVKPYQEDSLFWHSMCRTADRPGEGGLFVIMKKTRNLYHYAVRRIKKKAQKLLEASDSGSSDLLNEMKKVKGSKKF